MRVERIKGTDGAGIAVRSVGTGPGVVILHGGGLGGREYRRLAQALADRFTVHVYDRRGRPGAHPLDADHTVATDVADLAAVLEHTGARNVFGHSGGGFIAMHAALSLPLDRIALYDPALAIPGVTPTGWLDAFEEAVRAGDYARALAVMGPAGSDEGPAAKLPLGVRILLCRAFLHTPVGRRFADALPNVPTELRQILAHEGPATDYARVDADVLLAYGSRSPRHFARICDLLAAALPRARAIAVPRASHNAANVARARFVRPFADFFAGTLAPA
jgi:pimeloyl-ACP methyl ester carboxylesterase